MTRKTLALFLLGCAVLTFLVSPAPAQAIKPVTLWDKFPDFTLPAFQGGEVTLSKLQGKTVLLIFPRGWAAPDHWCNICNYQYAELAELEKTQGIRKANNLEILFVMPYSREVVQDWLDKFPAQMKAIEDWKNPPDAEKLDEKGKARVERIRKALPNKYLYEPGQVPLPFPVLLDADRTLSKGLGLFSTDWGGSKVDQNIPCVFIIGLKGGIHFKYLSQNTFDRPTAEYLLKYIAKDKK